MGSSSSVSSLVLSPGGRLNLCHSLHPSPVSDPAFYLPGHTLDLALSGSCGSCPSPSLSLSDPVGLCPLFGGAALACAGVTLSSWLISAFGAAPLLALP